MKYNDDGTYEDIVIKAVAPGRNSYSSSQQEVYSCNYVNGIDTKVNNITGTILWTNPNPNDSMAGGTGIVFNSDDYDVFETIYKVTNTGNYLLSQKCIKGYNVILTSGIYGSKGRGIYYRELNRTDDTHYTLANGEYFAANGNGNDMPSTNIPIMIVGYKTGITFN